MSEAVELHAPDPRWSAEFATARALILPCFDTPPLLVEHMGSTAVQGLPAKPIIDIIALVDGLASGHRAAPALAAVGFVHRADYADGTKLLFMKRHPQSQLRTHHLHVHADVGEVRRHLLFRDQLRADSAVRDAYRDLKQDLSVRFRDDREAYSRHKTAFVDAVVESLGGPARRVDWSVEGLEQARARRTGQN